MRRIVIVLALLCAVSYAAPNPETDKQSVEIAGGVGVYGLTACETLHIYDYRVATARYKNRLTEHFQIGAALGYVNRTERYRVNLETGKGEPIDRREVLNLGGALLAGSFLWKNGEITLGLGALGGKDEEGAVLWPWPHATLKLGPQDLAYVGASVGDPSPPYHTTKFWIGAYPIPELHLHAGVGMFGPVLVSPFIGADWRADDVWALSAVFEYHVPNDYDPVDFDTSLFGGIGVNFYF